MADYRAKNRNNKASDLARVRAAAKFSTPAPKPAPYRGGHTGPNFLKQVATATPLTPNQKGRFYEATGIENGDNPLEIIKGEVLNTGMSFVQVLNSLVNNGVPEGGDQFGINGETGRNILGSVIGGPVGSVFGKDAVARGAGNILGRMLPYGVNTTDTDKAVDTYTKYGTGGVTKQDIANLLLTGTGIKAGIMGVKALKAAPPVAKIAAATIGAAGGLGLVNSDDAQAGVPGAASGVTAGVRGAKILARLGEGDLPKIGTTLENTGIYRLLKDITGADDTFDPNARKIVEGVLKNFRSKGNLAVRRVDSALSNAKEVGASLEDTVKNRMDETVDTIHSYDTGYGTTLGDLMDHQGMAPFKYAADQVWETGTQAVHALDGRPTIISDQNINDSVGFMKRAAPEVADALGFVVKTGKGKIEVPHGQNIWQNDHLIPLSFARHLIGASADKLLKGRKGLGKLTQSWHDDSQALLDFVNHPDNIKRVNAWWNQVKANNSIETAAKDFYNQFPEAAKSHLNPDYMAYGRDMTNDLGNLLDQTSNFTSSNMSRIMDSLPDFKQRR